MRYIMVVVAALLCSLSFGVSAASAAVIGIGTWIEDEPLTGHFILNLSGIGPDSGRAARLPTLTPGLFKGTNWAINIESIVEMHTTSGPGDTALVTGRIFHLVDPHTGLTDPSNDFAFTFRIAGNTGVARRGANFNSRAVFTDGHSDSSGMHQDEADFTGTKATVIRTNQIDQYTIDLRTKHIPEPGGVALMALSAPLVIARLRRWVRRPAHVGSADGRHS